MEEPMISRVWHGWTMAENADTYEALLRSEIFPGIVGRRIAGLERIELFRRELGAEVEFMTVMWFTSLEAVKAFAGEDHEAAYVPARCWPASTIARGTTRCAPPCRPLGRERPAMEQIGEMCYSKFPPARHRGAVRSRTPATRLKR
jgi:hypothetical protein